MICSLDSHHLGYSLTTPETFSLLTTTAVPYALRHRELAQIQENNWLGHQVLFISECIPVIGILVAAIEYLVASYFRSLISSTTQAHLREARNYFIHTEIPAPLTFPDIDVDGLSQNDLIETLLKKYNGLCIGESHADSSPKYFLTLHMPLFKRLGVDVLYVEGYANLQRELDAYCSGERDTVDLPAPIREKINRFPLKDPKSYSEIDVLMAAKQEGIRIVNIDSTVAQAPHAGLRRVAAMNYQAKLIIDRDRLKHPGGKSIIYAGAAHTNRCTNLPGLDRLYDSSDWGKYFASVPSLGQMYQFPAINIHDNSLADPIQADAVLQPSDTIQKEIIEEDLLSERIRNIDFFIQMDTPFNRRLLGF